MKLGVGIILPCFLGPFLFPGQVRSFGCAIRAPSSSALLSIILDAVCDAQGQPGIPLMQRFWVKVRPRSFHFVLFVVYQRSCQYLQILQSIHLIIIHRLCRPTSGSSFSVSLATTCGRTTSTTCWAQSTRLKHGV